MSRCESHASRSAGAWEHAPRIRTLCLVVLALVVALPAWGADYRIDVSGSANRSAPVPLEGATVSGAIYAFTAPATGATRVRFYLDDPTQSGSPSRTENTAPFDFAGGSVSTANAFDTSSLAEGDHTITAALDLSGGSTAVVHATFTVDNVGPALVFGASTVSVTLAAGTTTTRQLSLTASDDTSVAPDLAESASWLTTSKSPSSTPLTVTLTFNSTGLVSGTYTTTLDATAAGYAAAHATVSLVVSASSSSYLLSVSTSSNRSAPTALAGQALSGNAYIFVSPTSGAAGVKFYLDDPDQTTVYRQENTAPYDLRGGSVSTANPLDTDSLSPGTHTVTAKITLSAGGSVVISETFSSGSVAEVLEFERDSVCIHEDDADEPLTLLLAASDGSAAAFTVTTNVPWLDVDPGTGSTPTMLEVTASTAGLGDGIHEGRLDATSSTLGSASALVRLVIGDASPPDHVRLAWVDDPSTTLTVVWRTQTSCAEPAVTYRELGTTTWHTAAGAIRPSGTGGTLHEATLPGLTPATTYEYRVEGDGDALSDTFTTRTAPAAGDAADFQAVYFADTGIAGRADGLTTGTAGVLEEIGGLDPHVFLLGGDYAYYNTETRYDTVDEAIDGWFDQMGGLGSRAPFMPCYGNHEALLGEGFSFWEKRFPTPAGFDGRRNFSFDMGDVHFISIFAVHDTEGLRTGTIAWLEDDMDAAIAAGQRWIVPFFHVSPFAEGTNHSSNTNLRAELGPLFEDHGVKIAISSHDQAYERSWPLIDVPASNTRTSTAGHCFSETDDGVTWVKVSPGGKLSNISGTFSPFRTSTPPSWTAERDNTLHHYAHLLFFADGRARVDIYGLARTGDPAVLVDTFTYSLDGTCPPELGFDEGFVSLALDEGETDTALLDLDTDSGTVTFELETTASWLSATADSSTTPAHVTVTVDATGLAAGVHRAAVRATATDSPPAICEIELTVAGDTAILFSKSSSRSNALPLADATVTGNIFAFTSPDDGVASVRFYLDDPDQSGVPRRTENTAPFDFAGGTVTAAKAFNTNTLSSGQHTITAELTLTAGGTVIVHATFTR